jgi:hypothetical protein
MGEAEEVNRIQPIKFTLIFASHTRTLLALTKLALALRIPSRLHGFET